MTTIEKALERHDKRMDETLQNKTAFWYLNKLIDDLKELKTDEVKALDNAYDKGFKDGNHRDLTGSLIEHL